MIHKMILVGLTLGMAAFAASQPYFLRGGFNGWPGNGGQELTPIGDGTFNTVITGVSGDQEFKVAQASGWDNTTPSGGNASGVARGDGTIAVRYIPTPVADGWADVGGRLGIIDADDYGWEIMGSFNGWSSPFLTLNKLGAGRYQGMAVVAPGSYNFKFRKTGDWDVNVGSDGGKGGDIALNVLAGQENVWFDLDRENGRFKVSTVPEPATLAAVGLGLAALAARRRRKA